MWSTQARLPHAVLRVSCPALHHFHSTALTRSISPCLMISRGRAPQAARWYARQKRKGVLVPFHVPQLMMHMVEDSKSVPSSSQMLSPAPVSQAGCFALGVTSHRSSASDLTEEFVRDVFQSLTVQQKEELAVFFFSHGEVPAGLHPNVVLGLLLDAPSASSIPLFLRVALFAQPALLGHVDAKHLLRCFELGMSATDEDNLLGTPNAVALKKKWIAWAEIFVGDVTQRVAVLHRAGLVFESIAYQQTGIGAAFPFSPVVEIPRDRASHAHGGFGPEIICILSQPHLSIPAVEKLCREMPPVLRRYTVHLCLLSWCRSRLDGAERRMPTPDWFTAEALQQSTSFPGFLLRHGLFTMPELLHTVHVTLRQGHQHTARRLLSSSQTREDIATVLRETCEAGVDLCLQAVQHWHQYFPEDTFYVVLYVGDTASCGRRSEVKEEVVTVELRFEPAAVAPPDLTFSPQEKREGPRLLQAMTSLSHDMVSWSARRLVHNGNMEEALSALATASRLGDILDESLLVELLLSSIGHRHPQQTSWLSVFATFYQEHFPSVVGRVFRCAVDQAQPQGRERLLPLLGAVAELGFVYFPEGLLRKEDGATVMELRRLIQMALPRLSVLPGDAPQQLLYVRHFLQAAVAVNLRVTMDVVVTAATPCGGSGRQCWWWSSRGARAGGGVTDRLYRKKVSQLWPVALQEVLYEQSRLPCEAEMLPAAPCSNPDQLRIHKATRLASVGCDDPAALFTVMESAQEWLLQSSPPPGSLGYMGRRDREGRDSALVRTLLCAAEILLWRGQHRDVLRLLPSNENLPKCLKNIRHTCERLSRRESLCDGQHENENSVLHQRTRAQSRRRSAFNSKRGEESAFLPAHLAALLNRAKISRI